jgi:hypothetical protein
MSADSDEVRTVRVAVEPDPAGAAVLSELRTEQRLRRPGRYRVGGRGGRSAPPATQGSLFDVEVRSERRYYSQMLDALSRSGFGANALSAELTVSKLFGTVWEGQETRDGSLEEAFGLGLVEFARGQLTPTSLALLQTVAVVAPIREVREAARHAAGSLIESGLPAPQWMEMPGDVTRPGTVVPGRCWAYEDVFGDQSVLISEFAYGRDPQADGRHAILMQIDHVAFSAATNTMLVDQVDATIRELTHDAANSGTMATLRQVDPAWARAIQSRALARTDLIPDVPIWPRYADVRALALARLAVLAEAADILPLDPEPAGSAGRAAIVAQFLESKFLAFEDEDGLDRRYAESVARIVLDHGCLHDPGNVIRVSPAKWDSFLFDWWPSRGIAGPWPVVVRAWSRWAADQLGLPQVARAELVESLDEALDSPPS